MNPTNEQLQQIPIKSIAVVSNVRSDMDAQKLAELEAMISSSGMAQPVELRRVLVAGTPVPDKYIVTFGHRRLEVAKRLGWTEVPAIVRDRSEAEIELLQIQENDGREDLHVLDRAAGYKKLQERGMDAAAISSHVGRARSTVELTLRLADLVEGARKALVDGWLPQGAAEELALLAPGVQGEGLKLLQDLDHDGELTRERAREVLRRELLLDLADVRFDIRDPDLVPAAGACVPDCAKRTGAQPDLFGGAKKGPDCCTDKPCLRLKEGAWLRQQEQAGRKVLTGAEVKANFETRAYDGADDLKWNSEYQYADSAARKRLGKEGKGKILLARAPSGAVVEVVKKADVHGSPASSSSSTSAPEPRPQKTAAEKRRELEQKAAREAVGRALTDIAQHLAGGKLGEHDVDLAELAFRALLRESHKDTKVALARLLLLEPAKGYDGADTALLAHYEATEKKRKAPGWDFVALAALAPALLVNVAYADMAALEDLKKFLKLLGAGDFTKIRADVERELRQAAQVKAAKKVAKKKTSKREASLPLPDVDEDEHPEEGGHLVMASGSTFHLTHAGAKAIGGGWGKQGDQVQPGSAIAQKLVELAAGGAKLNKKLQRLHAKAGTK